MHIITTRINYKNKSMYLNFNAYQITLFEDSKQYKFQTVHTSQQWSEKIGG
jgi:hypothetical protein